jgi:hypothetical protein
MNTQEVESLRKQYAGRCVTVDAQRPELARMAGKTGRVKTVNFNGRALVQFEGPDRSWYDIDPHYIIPLQEESP